APLKLRLLLRLLWRRRGPLRRLRSSAPLKQVARGLTGAVVLRPLRRLRSSAPLKQQPIKAVRALGDPSPTTPVVGPVEAFRNSAKGLEGSFSPTTPVVGPVEARTSGGRASRRPP